MAVNDYLTRDEINALLHNSSDDVVTTEKEVASCGEEDTTRLDYLENGQNKSLYEKFPMLETVNERFSGFFNSALSKLLACDIEITTDRVGAVKFSDYTHGLFVPTSMNIARIKPFDNIGLFVFDPKLVFMLADKYFGGEGRPFKISEGREFAPTELRVIEMILEKLFVTLGEAWSPVTALEPVFTGSDINPQLTNVLEKNEVVVVNIFRICIDDLEGDLHVTFPCTLLESLKKLSESNV